MSTSLWLVRGPAIRLFVRAKFICCHCGRLHWLQEVLEKKEKKKKSKLFASQIHSWCVRTFRTWDCGVRQMWSSLCILASYHKKKTHQKYKRQQCLISGNIWGDHPYGQFHEPPPSQWVWMVNSHRKLTADNANRQLCFSVYQKWFLKFSFGTLQNKGDDFFSSILIANGSIRHCLNLPPPLLQYHSHLHCYTFFFCFTAANQRVWAKANSPPVLLG